MTRDTQIPLFLWIATAVVAHLLWGGGADQVAQVVSERVEIREFAASVRRFVRGENKPVEVTLLEDQSETEKKTDPEAPEEPETPPAPPDQKSAQADEAPPAEPKDVKHEEKKPEVVKKPEPPKPEEKKPEEEKVEEAKVEPTPPPEELQKRVAVKQHVEDKNQADNPNAEFLGDEANHVKDETQARITSTDQNDPNPTPGAAATAAAKDQSDPGNAEKTRVADSEDRPGEKNKAPGIKPAPSELRITPAPAAQPSKAAEGAEGRQEGARVASRTSSNQTRLPAQEGAEAQPALKAAEATPDTLDSSQGGWEIAGERAASIEQAGRQAKKKRLPPLRSTSATDLLGLGGTGRTPGGVNLNLSPEVAVAAIGRDTLRKELRADGERRRSEHAGRWRPVGIERWRASIENYVASVKPGNQTALNTARAPFASYLNQIHVRIHPIFAETFLDSLDQLPSSHPMNRAGITTNLEIVLDRDEGRIQRMGITKTSGVTAFDVAALEAVHRAQPFGTPPTEIVSPDGNVYFHWEFHRNREEACSTYFARPYILKGQPKSAPPPTPSPEPPPDPEGRERHGSVTAPTRKTLAFVHARP